MCRKKWQGCNAESGSCRLVRFRSQDFAAGKTGKPLSFHVFAVAGGKIVALSPGDIGFVAEEPKPGFKLAGRGMDGLSRSFLHGHGGAPLFHLIVPHVAVDGLDSAATGGEVQSVVARNDREPPRRRVAGRIDSSISSSALCSRRQTTRLSRDAEVCVADPEVRAWRRRRRWCLPGPPGQSTRPGSSKGPALNRRGRAARPRSTESRGVQQVVAVDDQRHPFMLARGLPPIAPHCLGASPDRSRRFPAFRPSPTRHRRRRPSLRQPEPWRVAPTRV